MLVRPVSEPDCAAWARMRAALWPGEPVDDLARESQAFLSDPAAGEPQLTAVFVSEDPAGRLTGFIEIFVRNYAEGCSGPTPYVEGWYVEPGARGRGAGRALMRAAEDWARALGFAELASDTPLDNEASQRAHAALGFEEVERIVHFRKPVRTPVSYRTRRRTES